MERDDRDEKCTRIRLTVPDDEPAEWAALAEAAGTTLTAWIRERLNENRPLVPRATSRHSGDLRGAVL